MALETSDQKGFLLLVSRARAPGLLWHKNLGARQCSLTIVTSSQEALSAVRQRSYRLTVIDDDLPSFNLVFFVRKLRQESHLPLLLLTKGGTSTRTQALRAGADICLSKPVDTEEFWARIDSLLRRTRTWAEKACPVCPSGIELDPDRRSVRCEDTLIPLPGAEWYILQLLLRAGGQAVSRDRLVKGLQDYGFPSSERSIDARISVLRKRVVAFRHCIHTVVGVGYRFVPTCWPLRE